MDFSQENDLWQQLQTTSEIEDQRQQLLEMARLLIERATPNTTAFEALESDVLTDLFLEYQGIGQITGNFLQTALPRLEAAYQGTEFEQQLKTLQTDLQHYQQRYHSLQQQLQQLQDTETELKQQKAHCQQTQIDVKQLQQNAEHLQTELEQLQQTPAEAEAAVRDSEQQQAAALQAIVAAIPRLVRLIEASRASYQHHFTANETITAALNAQPSLTDIARYTDKISELSPQLQELLTEFDAALRHIVLAEEKHRHLLRELRDPKPTLTRPDEEGDD